MSSRPRRAAALGATALAAALGAQLGVGTPTVKAALRDAGARAARPDRRPLAAELASSLGRDEAEVRAALARLRASS